jgi:hypothetical protein
MSGFRVYPTEYVIYQIVLGVLGFILMQVLWPLNHMVHFVPSSYIMVTQAAFMTITALSGLVLCPLYISQRGTPAVNTVIAIAVEVIAILIALGMVGNIAFSSETVASIPLIVWLGLAVAGVLLVFATTWVLGQRFLSWLYKPKAKAVS